MSYVNTKTVAQVLLEMELEIIESGCRKLGFGNQFDETVIESALENLKDLELNDKDVVFLSKVNNAMDIAHRFSTFEYPSDMYSNVY